MRINSLGTVLVTGGLGFIGAYLTKRLVDEGLNVRVFDNLERGNIGRLTDCIEKVDFVEGDITNYADVLAAMAGIDSVFHLAYINGTRNFYSAPDRVLAVGVKGALNTLDAAQEQGVKNYIVTSSSEVYHLPQKIPTDESVSLTVPDVRNPRYSYSGGKIITELLAIHYAKPYGIRSVVCRPHNFYGPDMGYSHVIPELVGRLLDLSENVCAEEIHLPIQGTGEETRAFCFIDDAIEGLIIAALEGSSGEVYHIGTEQEISVRDLVGKIATVLELDVDIVPGPKMAGAPDRRCPKIGKIAELGFSPRVSLKEGISRTVEWYRTNRLPATQNTRGEIHL